MEAVIQLRSDVAALLNGVAIESLDGDDLKRAKRDLDDALKRLGLTLSPAHPARRDAELKRYFVLTGSPQQTPEDVLLSLRRLEAVTAAYSNPRVVRAWS